MAQPRGAGHSQQPVLLYYAGAGTCSIPYMRTFRFARYTLLVKGLSLGQTHTRQLPLRGSIAREAHSHSVHRGASTRRGRARARRAAVAGTPLGGKRQRHEHATGPRLPRNRCPGGPTGIRALKS